MKLNVALSLAALSAIIALMHYAKADTPATTPSDSVATQPSTSPAAAATTAKSVLDFTLNDIDGNPVPLASYQGKVILIVNVASKCGHTPQYKALEQMYEDHKAQGFVVLGFPANDFHAQEPGTNAEIKEFCSSTYHVAFPMFSKISVLGADQAPLYAYLTAQDTQPQPKGDITWNFEKFLIARDGSVIARFSPKTEPDDAQVTSAVVAALAAKPL